MDILLESLFWGGVAATIAGVADRSVEEVLAAGAAGATAGLFMGEVSAVSDPKAKCIVDALEYLVVVGDAAEVDIRDDRIAVKIAEGITPSRVAAALYRCDPESVWESQRGDWVMAKF